jgi:hypothetical protein
MVDKERFNTCIPYDKAERMSPKFKSFVEKIKCGEIDETELDPAVVKEIGKYLSTNSRMEETVLGYTIIDWMRSQKILGEEKDVSREIKTFAEKQIGGRGLARTVVKKPRT